MGKPYEEEPILLWLDKWGQGKEGNWIIFLKASPISLFVTCNENWKQ